MPQVKILAVRTVGSTQPGRAGQPATWVVYREGPSGDPRSVFIEKRDPTTLEIEQAIAADIRRHGQLQGHEFTI